MQTTTLVPPSDDSGTTDESSPANATAIPLWAPGEPRPISRERRKNPAATDRHIQARTGVAPAGCVEQRRRHAVPPPTPSIVALWLE